MLAAARSHRKRTASLDTLEVLECTHLLFVHQAKLNPCVVRPLDERHQRQPRNQDGGEQLHEKEAAEDHQRQQHDVAGHALAKSLPRKVNVGPAGAGDELQARDGCAGKTVKVGIGRVVAKEPAEELHARERRNVHEQGEEQQVRARVRKAELQAAYGHAHRLDLPKHLDGSDDAEEAHDTDEAKGEPVKEEVGQPGEHDDRVKDVEIVAEEAQRAKGDEFEDALEGKEVDERCVHLIKNFGVLSGHALISAAE